MEKKTYFQNKENEGFNRLLDFNEKVLNLNNFGRCPEKHHTDASGVTKDNRFFNIEIKVRNQNLLDNKLISGCTSNERPYTANTLFIEQHKCCSMLLDYVCDLKEPIYVNFLNNAVIVFNLSRLKHRPETQGMKIKSKGYGKMEVGTREGLTLDDAAIYIVENNNYKLIQVPQ